MQKTPTSEDVPLEQKRSESVLPSRAESRRLEQTLHEHDVLGERAIATAQGVICSFLLVLLIGAQISTKMYGNPWVLAGLVALVASSGLRLMMAKAGTLPAWRLNVLTVADAAIFIALIWCYQFAYGHPAGGSLKAPSQAFLFVIVALRVLRFDARPILIAGATAIVGWLVLVALSIGKDGVGSITHDYVEYLSTSRILVGAELEKAAALLALVTTVTIASLRARRILSQAAHVTDYAEALAASERHLQEAKSARAKAETALEELRARDAEMMQQNQRFSAAVENMSQGLCMLDREQRLVVCNDRFIGIYGMPRSLVEPGTLLRSIVEDCAARGLFMGRAGDMTAEERSAAVVNTTASNHVIELSDGRTISIASRPMASGGWVITHDDITRLRRTELRIAHLAFHDALTGLPNRVSFQQHLKQWLAKGCSRDGASSLALLILDVDRFKEVNDTLGHTAGDTLLKMFGERLRANLKEGDVLARLGGDEFAILHCAASPATSAILLANRLLAALSQPFDMDGHTVFSGACIGISIAPSDGRDADTLLKNAALAVHRAKGEKISGFRFFAREMDEQMQKRRRLEQDLRGALAAGQIELHYQPQFDLGSEKITGCEALLRWRHPEHGFISPAEFVPLAEEIGLIISLGEWALHQACRDAASWPRSITVAVNVSALQFKDNEIVASVVAALAASGLAPHRLELEVTETALIQDSDVAVSTLHILKDLGVRLSLDDFGTGYSSLSYLRMFPFHKLKIDRSFVSDLSSASEEALAIVRSVALLGASLDMRTTAEGVETVEQMEIVRAQGYTSIQGYLISPARPAAEIARLLASRSPAPFKSGLQTLASDSAPAG